MLLVFMFYISCFHAGEQIHHCVFCRKQNRENVRAVSVICFLFLGKTGKYGSPQTGLHGAV